MTIEATGGWCAPSDFILSALPTGDGVLDLPVFSVERGGIDFNAPRPTMAETATQCEHRWERMSRALQCDCAQCHVDDPRGLDCWKCPKRLSPDDPEFEALYEAAPWWWDE